MSEEKTIEVNFNQEPTGDLTGLTKSEKKNNKPIEETIKNCEKIIQRTGGSAGDDRLVTLEEATQELIDDDVDHFPTGYETIDDAITGARGGDLFVISGCTGEGKTLMAQSLTHNFNKLALPILWFSYEVSLKHLNDKFNDMKLNNEMITYVPMKIESGKVDWIEQKIKEGVKRFNTKIIFIDHLGFLLPKTESIDSVSQNYAAYLGTICRNIKTLAVNENVIVFLLAHVRKTDSPTLNDLKDSSGIAQEADFVLLIERLKEKTSKGFMDEDVGDLFTNQSRISLAKNRRTGQTKRFKVQFSNGRLVDIKDVDPEDYLNS